MSSTLRPIDPHELIRHFRTNYVNLYRLWRETRRTPLGVQIYAPTERPLSPADLPEPIRTAISDYLKRTPSRRVTVVKRLRFINGEPSLVVEDEDDLPPEDHLFIASQTVTINAADTFQVVTDLYVMRLE